MKKTNRTGFAIKSVVIIFGLSLLFASCARQYLCPAYSDNKVNKDKEKSTLTTTYMNKNSNHTDNTRIPSYL